MFRTFFLRHPVYRFIMFVNWTVHSMELHPMHCFVITLIHLCTQKTPRSSTFVDCNTQICQNLIHQPNGLVTFGMSLTTGHLQATPKSCQPTACCSCQLSLLSSVRWEISCNQTFSYHSQSSSTSAFSYLELHLQLRLCQGSH